MCMVRREFCEVNHFLTKILLFLYPVPVSCSALTVISWSFPFDVDYSHQCEIGLVGHKMQ